MSGHGAVLVTGATGFVGRALIARLASAGRPVVAAVRQFVTGFPIGVSERPISPIETMSPADWLPHLEGVDCIIHLAAIAHIGTGVPEVLYDAINHRALVSLAQAARQVGVRRLVFLSSVRAISGPSSPTPLTDASEPRPTDAYGRSKLAAEEALATSGLEHVVLRPVVIVGPGVKGNVAALARAARSRLLWPYAGLKGRRSLVSLDDVVAAIERAIDDPAMAGGRYALAGGGPMTLAAMIGELRTGMAVPDRALCLPQALIRIPLNLIGRSDIWERIGCDLIVEPTGLRSLGFEFRHSARAALQTLGRSPPSTGRKSE